MIITDGVNRNRCQSSCLFHSDWAFQADGMTLQGYKIMFYGVWECRSVDITQSNYCLNSQSPKLLNSINFKSPKS